MKITITLNEVQVKALSYVMVDPEEWTRNVISERARIAAEELVDKETARMLADPDITEIPADADTIILNAPEFVPPTLDDSFTS